MSDPITMARDTALLVLNPTQRELEYGLRLHQESVVCESYGFGPYAAPDGRLLNDLIQKGQTSLSIRDAMEKMQMTGFLHNAREQEEYFRAWEASGVTCVFQNAGFENQAIPEALKRLAHYIHVTDVLSPRIRKATTTDDVIAAHAEGKHCVILTCNAIPLAQQWQFVGDELAYIGYFHELGCRMMHFTYNRRNMLGDGCMEPSNGGISDLGRSAIEMMNNQGMIIDVAHSGQQTSLEVAKSSKRPIVASHTGAFSINPHPRNKTDDVIRAIVETEGVIGICGIPAFLGQGGDINALLNHVDYITSQFGANYVAIGTDVAYHSRYFAEEMSKVDNRQVRPPTFESLWRDDEPFFSPDWQKPEQIQSLAWTNWPIFTVGLVQRGYTESNIRKIIGGNILRVAADVANDSTVRD